MKYLIQVFISKNGSTTVGQWDNTNFGGDDLQKVMDTANSITKNRQGIIKVRVLEVLKEFDVNPELVINDAYEYKVGKTIKLIRIDENIPNHGLVCTNLKSKRSVFVPQNHIRLLTKIDNLQEWLLHNGD